MRTICGSNVPAVSRGKCRADRTEGDNCDQYRQRAEPDLGVPPRATARADSDAVAAAFTEDAFLDDWGRQYRGRDGIREWDRTDNVGVQSRITLTALKPGPEAGTYIGTVSVTGNGFNGTGTMTFTLRGDLIASLLIG